jgi:hypothetical protein
MNFTKQKVKQTTEKVPCTCCDACAKEIVRDGYTEEYASFHYTKKYGCASKHDDYIVKQENYHVILCADCGKKFLKFFKDAKINIDYTKYD